MGGAFHFTIVAPAAKRQRIPLNSQSSKSKF
jgi:hypothetical protein